MVALVVLVLLRLTPFLWTSTVFSTDTWPLIKDSVILASNSSIKVFDDRVFDGYHNRWPGVMLSSSMLSLVAGVDLCSVYAVLMVMVLNTALILCFYAVSKRLGGGIASAILMASFPSLVVFTSATLKEVYSYPIMASTILLVVSSSSLKPLLVLFPLASLAQVLSHPLSAVMEASILANTVLIGLLKYLRDRASSLQLVLKALLYTSIAAPISLAYMKLLASKSISVAVKYPSVLGVLGFFAILDSLYVFARLDSPRLRGVKLGVLTLIASITVLVAASFLNMTPYNYDTAGILPYIAGSLILLSTPREDSTISAATAISVSGALIYAYTSPGLGSLIHRVLNYLSFYLGFSIIKGRASKAYSILGLAVASVIMLQLLAGYDTVSFYWLYTRSDLELAGFLESYANGSRIVADEKLYYLSMYTGSIHVDTEAVRGLLSGSYKCRSSVIALYRDNTLKGFALGSSVYGMTSSARRLLEASSLVYSSPTHKLYSCTG